MSIKRHLQVGKLQAKLSLVLSFVLSILPVVSS
jgi:hypothetical protein